MAEPITAPLNGFGCVPVAVRELKGVIAPRDTYAGTVQYMRQLRDFQCRVMTGHHERQEFLDFLPLLYTWLARGKPGLQGLCVEIPCQPEYSIGFRSLYQRLFAAYVSRERFRFSLVVHGLWLPPEVTPDVLRRTATVDARENYGGRQEVSVANTLRRVLVDSVEDGRSENEALQEIRCDGYSFHVEFVRLLRDCVPGPEHEGDVVLRFPNLRLLEVAGLDLRDVQPGDLYWLHRAAVRRRRYRVQTHPAFKIVFSYESPDAALQCLAGPAFTRLCHARYCKELRATQFFGPDVVFQVEC